MIRCKDCKHWGRVNAHPEHGYAQCAIVGDILNGYEEDGTVGNIIAVDYAGYMAWIETKEDFGCVNGESK